MAASSGWASSPDCFARQIVSPRTLLSRHQQLIKTDGHSRGPRGAL
ncbi:hypothetical protein [Streptomyces sp. NPDC086766]